MDQASPRGIPFHEDKLSGYNIRRSMLLSRYTGDNERDKEYLDNNQVWKFRDCNVAAPNNSITRLGLALAPTL